MTDHWPEFHQPAQRWLAKVERAVERHAGDHTGAMMAITNAIQYQLEIGAHVPTLTALISALQCFVQACNVNPAHLHLDEPAESLVHQLQPKGG